MALFCLPYGMANELYIKASAESLSITSFSPKPRPMYLITKAKSEFSYLKILTVKSQIYLALLWFLT